VELVKYVQSDVMVNLSQMEFPYSTEVVDVLRGGYILSLACTFPVITFGYVQ
jgi:hypothetical protein